MGIDFGQLKFFDACYAHDCIKNPVLALGSLNIQETPQDVVAFAEASNYTDLLVAPSVKSLFFARYGISEYRDCDLNGSAEINLDLSQPIPKEYVGNLGSVLNGGTVEHIFDLRQVFENIHLMVRPGGAMLHLVPITWYNHGFINFNPLFFQSLSEVNNYSVLVEGFYFLSGIPPEGKGNPKVCLVRGGPEDEDSIRKVLELFESSRLPANSMYLIALRKNSDSKFLCPYQIAT